MYYVYILKSDSNKSWYIGYTEDLRKRFQQHNSGESKATKPYRPWKIIFYEAYLNQYDALRRERYLKSTKGRKTLQVMLSQWLQKCATL